jgi:hypothetical protein
MAFFKPNESRKRLKESISISAATVLRPSLRQSSQDQNLVLLGQESVWKALDRKAW